MKEYSFLSKTLGHVFLYSSYILKSEEPVSVGLVSRIINAPIYTCIHANTSITACFTLYRICPEHHGNYMTTKVKCCDDVIVLKQTC